MKCFTKREMYDILKYNKYEKGTKSNGGNHEKWYRNGRNPIPLPMNDKDLNPALCYGVIKRNELKIPPKLR